ncbi:excalibur calcium-binding domain-containing protein [Erythrobacter ani]|uniref:Excalibur calcium-binding domain-containing protein n=1 Tax=Erythrobacter ani TaxID=2827235 RepID=A0ABS6SPZ0_9SPHN|nr:excalibur calcium-binding domain-containing protein [Erythrobacter ani]MBV7266694.1 excalibur calcium-binding domain-containing protein [Erythrobacter ani]
MVKALSASAFSAIIALGLASIPVSAVIAHPGGLNAEGCHNNRKTGEYHCHRNPRASRPVQEAQSIQGDVYYRNCDAARAAGAAPIYRGQPGYRSALDRDNDGVACEPYRGRR